MIQQTCKIIHPTPPAMEIRDNFFGNNQGSALNKKWRLLGRDLADIEIFPGVFFHSRATEAYPVTTDLTMRVSVRTTTTASQSSFFGRHKWAPKRFWAAPGTSTELTNDHYVQSKCRLIHRLLITKNSVQMRVQIRVQMCTRTFPRRAHVVPAYPYTPRWAHLMASHFVSKGMRGVDNGRLTKASKNGVRPPLGFFCQKTVYRRPPYPRPVQR